MELDWKCPGRRAPSPQREEVTEPVENREIVEEEKDDGFDFEDDALLSLMANNHTIKLKYLNLSYNDLRKTSPAILAKLVIRMEEVYLTYSSVTEQHVTSILQEIVAVENEDDMSLKLLDLNIRREYKTDGGETLYINIFSDLFYQAKKKNLCILYK